MTTTKNNEHKKLNFSSEREQSQVCLNSAEHEKNQGRKVLNVPNLRFPEFQGEWITYKIRDVLSIGNGRDYKHLNNGEIPVFGTGGYMTSVDECLYDGETTFIGRKGSINKPFYYNGKFWTVDTLFYTHSFNGITPKFTYCLFQTINWLKYNEASGVPSLSRDTIEKIKINIPGFEEQNKIAKLMFALDERIATQNKIIEDLKKLKSAIIEIEYTPNTKTTSHIGNVIEQISKRNKNNAIQNVLSVSNRQGFIKQSEQFENRNVASEDTSNYKIVEKNDFAFNPARINVGSIARLTTFEKGIVSPMYICFRTQESVAPEYIDFFFESKHFYCEIQKRLEGSVRQCLSFEGLCNIPFSLPYLEMQQRIGKRLFTLGLKIKTETDLLELLNKQKQYLLRQMFI